MTGTQSGCRSRRAAPWHIPADVEISKPAGGLGPRLRDPLLTTLFEQVKGYESPEEEEDDGEIDPIMVGEYRLSDYDKLLQRVKALDGVETYVNEQGAPLPALSNPSLCGLPVISNREDDWRDPLTLCCLVY